MKKSTTSTRSVFTWLFLATRPNDKAVPTVLRTTSDTEEAARRKFRGRDLTFAARIRNETAINARWVEGHTIWTLSGGQVTEFNEWSGGEQHV